MAGFPGSESEIARTSASISPWISITWRSSERSTPRGGGLARSTCGCVQSPWGQIPPNPPLRKGGGQRSLPGPISRSCLTGNTARVPRRQASSSASLATSSPPGFGGRSRSNPEGSWSRSCRGWAASPRASSRPLLVRRRPCRRPGTAGPPRRRLHRRLCPR